MLNGTKKLFPTDYDKFTDAMITAAEEDELPVTLQMDDISKISLNDIQDLFLEFKHDTGLAIAGHLLMCRDCGMMHLLLDVDYPEDDEEERILQ